jgi:hypothetical protein
MRSARCGGAWAIFPAGALADPVRLRSGRDCTALRTAVPHYPLHITDPLHITQFRSRGMSVLPHWHVIHHRSSPLGKDGDAGG